MLFAATSFAQSDITKYLSELYNEDKYNEIIDFKPSNPKDLSAKDLYYIGMSYYMKSEDKDAMKYLEKAIKKGPVDQDMYYYKGMIYFYANEYEKAISFFNKAITLLPDEPDFYGSKGEAFYYLNNPDSAVANLKTATNFEECDPRYFLLLGETYQEINNLEGALLSYQSAIQVIDTNDESYQICSFNIGLMQQLSEDYKAANETFEKHIELYPTDFHAISKLIQSYYAIEEFDKAIPYKQKLYKAHEDGILIDQMKEMFCFDQFIWNGRRVMVFENFDEPDDFLFVKHHFYVLDEQGDVDYRIDSESSVAIRMNNTKYVLCLVKNESHYTYWHYLFNDDYQYPELKEAVLDILNKKVKPGSAFINNTKQK